VGPAIPRSSACKTSAITSGEWIATAIADAVATVMVHGTTDRFVAPGVVPCANRDAVLPGIRSLGADAPGGSFLRARLPSLERNPAQVWQVLATLLQATRRGA
jgi:hypothetical protein